MATYKSRYTGEEIDEAVGKALANNGGSGGSGGSKLYLHRMHFENRTEAVYAVLNTNTNLFGLTIIEIVTDYVVIPCSYGTYGDGPCQLIYKEYTLPDNLYKGRIKNLISGNISDVDGVCDQDNVVFEL